MSQSRLHINESNMKNAQRSKRRCTSIGCVTLLTAALILTARWNPGDVPAPEGFRIVVLGYGYLHGISGRHMILWEHPRHFPELGIQNYILSPEQLQPGAFRLKTLTGVCFLSSHSNEWRPVVRRWRLGSDHKWQREGDIPVPGHLKTVSALTCSPSTRWVAICFTNQHRYWEVYLIDWRSKRWYHVFTRAAQTDAFPKIACNDRGDVYFWLKTSKWDSCSYSITLFPFKGDPYSVGNHHQVLTNSQGDYGVHYAFRRGEVKVTLSLLQHPSSKERLYATYHCAILPFLRRQTAGEQVVCSEDGKYWCLLIEEPLASWKATDLMLLVWQQGKKTPIYTQRNLEEQLEWFTPIGLQLLP